MLIKVWVKEVKKKSCNLLHLYYEPQYQDLLLGWPQFTHVGNNPIVSCLLWTGEAKSQCQNSKKQFPFWDFLFIYLSTWMAA